MAKRRGRRKKGRRGGASRLRVSDSLLTLLLVLFVLVGVGSLLGEQVYAVLGSAVLILVIVLVLYVVYRVYMRNRRYTLRTAYENMRPQARDTMSLQDVRFRARVLHAYRRAGYDVLSLDLDAVGTVEVLTKDAKKFAVRLRNRALSSPIGEKDVRYFYHHVADLGYDGFWYVTSGRFTPSAVTWAMQHGVELVNGAALMELTEPPNEHGVLQRVMRKATR